MPTIFPTLRYFRLISVYSLTLNMFYNNIFIVSLMMSLHSEPRKAVSFMQAFVSRRRLIFDPLLGLNNSQGSLLFAPRRESRLSRKRLYAARRQFWLSRKRSFVPRWKVWPSRKRFFALRRKFCFSWKRLFARRRRNDSWQSFNIAARRTCSAA